MRRLSALTRARRGPDPRPRWWGACLFADDKVEDVVKAGAVEALVPLLTLRTELQARDGAGQSIPGCVARPRAHLVKTAPLFWAPVKRHT